MSTAENEYGREADKIKLLYEIAKALGTCLDLKEAYPRVLAILAQQLGMKRGALLVANSDTREWEIGGAHGLPAEEMKKGKDHFESGLVQQVREKGKIGALTERGELLWSIDGRGKAAPKRANISFLYAPVKVQGEIGGILEVDPLFSDPVPVAEDFALLEEICLLIGEALLMRKAMAAENRGLLEENWGYRKELETLGRTLPKSRKKISLTEILEERLSRMITELRIDPRSNGHLYEDVLIVVEKTLIKSALEKTKHVQSKTARFLGLNRNTLRRKMKELGITVNEK